MIIKPKTMYQDLGVRPDKLYERRTPYKICPNCIYIGPYWVNPDSEVHAFICTDHHYVTPDNTRSRTPIFYIGQYDYGWNPISSKEYNSTDQGVIGFAYKLAKDAEII